MGIDHYFTDEDLRRLTRFPWHIPLLSMGPVIAVGETLLWLLFGSRSPWVSASLVAVALAGTGIGILRVGYLLGWRWVVCGVWVARAEDWARTCGRMRFHRGLHETHHPIPVGWVFHDGAYETSERFGLNARSQLVMPAPPLRPQGLRVEDEPHDA